MKGTPKASTLALILVLPGILWAAESVSVVSELGQTRAAFSVGAGASSDVAVSLAIPAVAVNQVTMNGTEYDLVTLPISDHLFAAENADEGMPDVPVLTSLIAIPDMAGVELETEYGGFDIIDNIDLAPVQPATLESGEEVVPFAINSEAYSRDEFYPSDLATTGDPVIMRDVRMVQLVMNPVQYNPVRRQMRVYRDLSVNVNYTYGNEVVNPKTVRRPFMSEAFYPIYRDVVSNFDDYFSTATIKRGGILIISKQIFVDSLRALVNWKHRKGYHIKVAPTTEITPSGNPTSTQILTYLTNAYNTWEIPPEYVMIVGDQDNTTATGIPDYPYSSYTSDHRYTRVEGTDYLPDIVVTRLSIDNVTDLRKAVAKIMAYETKPFMGDPDYWLRGLSVAGNVYATTPRITVLWVRQLLLEHGFTRVDTSFRWASGESDSRLPNLFNQGVSFVSYRGWAGSSGWYSPSFNVGNLNSLTNTNKIGVMASIVCGTGNFGSGTDPCFGETWIRMGQSDTLFKGGPAFFGSTDGSTHTRWNNPIMVGFYWSIFRGGNDHFGAAAIRGKLQQYATFPGNSGPGGTVEQYFHTYNTLGDPELEVRTQIPIRISALHPATLPLGVNHIEISVIDTAFHAIPDAYVVLTKGYGIGEEVFETAKTDANGNVIMSFSAQSPDTMFVTVSGPDLYPYQGHVMIVQTDVAVGPDSLIIDDDNAGYSFGSADGIVNPAETIELSAGLKNFGNVGIAQNVSATLEAITPELVTIYRPSVIFGNLGPGAQGFSAVPFVIGVNVGALDGDLIRMKLTVTADSLTWVSEVELPVTGARFNVTAVTFPGGNGRLDPGDSVGMIITLANIGQASADAVSGTVTTRDGFTAILSGMSNFGVIPAGGSGNNADNPISLRLDPAAFDGRNINMILDVITSTGIQTLVPFTVTVGTVSAVDPTGPDAYGYYMYDNTDIGYVQVPTYQWVEIAPSAGGQGTRITFPNTDDASAMIEFPFDFVYYGRAESHMIVSINGFAAFDTFRFDMAGNFWYNFFNWPIPDPGNGSGQISPFWDDLGYSGTTYGVFTWHDTTEHRFIIEWYHMTHKNTSAIETFEMIIYDPAYHPTISGDCEIVYQYNAIQNNDSSEGYASVGFESHDELMGIQYTYHNSYPPSAASLANGRAIKITTNTGRGAISGTITIEGGTPAIGALVLSSTGQRCLASEDGSYRLTDVPPGYADLTVSAPGYFTQILPSVYVAADLTTDNINFVLTGCPTPTNLVASDTIIGVIDIVWSPVAHDSLLGYNVYRANWQNGEFAKLNSTLLTNPVYSDVAILDSVVYWFYATAVFQSAGGQVGSFGSNMDAGSTQIIVGVDDDGMAIPTAFFLADNYPNPFNPSTSISFGLPKDALVKLEVFNLLGQKVKTLLAGNQRAGYKQIVWDGRDNGGKAVASGIYFYRLTTDGDFDQTKKMLLVK
ncbi:MAG: hypothetical protein A2W25_00375 [candidate division Zixibacteria bacterium RBG_16_53_22]|nr:MAG: hypothetical protein A2W25_00375 [candidate division Zixibacteria bacterium RBG_16_53_22]